jgi:hypothetical protein
VKSRRANFAHTGPARGWVIVACLLLLSVSAATQAHIHADDLAATASHCPICHVAHSSAQVALVVELDRVLTTTDFVCTAPDADNKSNFELSWHFSRPPPQA